MITRKLHRTASHELTSGEDNAPEINYEPYERKNDKIFTKNVFISPNEIKS